MMRKAGIILAGLWILLGQITFAQTDEDALRYSMRSFGGTARSMGIAGAMTSLGADFSVINDNPGGLGLYSSHEFTFSPQLLRVETMSEFLDNETEARRYNFNFNNIGLVLEKELQGKRGNRATEGWISVNFGMGMNRLDSYHQKTYLSGVNAFNSLLDNYTQRLNAAPVDLRDDASVVGQQTLMAYNAFLINPVDTNFTSFNNVAEGGAVRQQITITEKGKMDEYSFAVAANYDHRLYFGGALGIPVIRYERNMLYEESDEADTIAGFRSFELTDDLITTGAGVNLKFGLIYRINNWLRVGGAVHTPTWLSLHDNYQSSIQSEFDTTSYEVESPEGEFDYNLAAPWRLQSGISFIIKKYGFISLDYEYVDYGEAYYTYEDEFNDIAQETNDVIGSKYGSAHNFKIGAEAKIDKVAIRGGYAYYGTPFKDFGGDKGDLHEQSISAGFGYREDEFFLDFAYVRDITSSFYAPYTLASATAPFAINDINRDHFVATFGLRF